MLDIIKDVESEIFIISQLIKSYDDDFVLLENESNNFLVYSKSKILVNANNLIKESLSPILFLKESNSFDKPKLMDLINNIYPNLINPVNHPALCGIQSSSVNEKGPSFFFLGSISCLNCSPVENPLQITPRV